MSSSDVPPQDVTGSDWDYLVVLDACRYDVFQRVHGDYLDGRLVKRRSPGSGTPEWVAETFTDWYDLTYLSANPFVNSLGIPLNELRWGGAADCEWTAADHFTEVVDLWRDEWDDDLGTVAPDVVTAATRERLGRGLDGRAIVHYLQPHGPYLRRGKGRINQRVRAGVTAADAPDDRGSLREFAEAVGQRLRARVEPLLGTSRLAMKLGTLVELHPRSLFTLGSDGFRSSLAAFYEENLRLALAAVADLVETLSGRVVVTADHGEAFGERGVWGHPVGHDLPALVEVPWFVVDGRS